MADEKQPAEEKKPVTDKSVTDADLEEAWKQPSGVVDAKVDAKVKEAKEPEKEEIKPEEEEEPTDHSERSRMGRRVKRIEDMIGQLSSKLDSFNYQPPRERQETNESTSDIVSTAEDVERVLQAREEKRAKEQANYEKKYLGKLMSFSAEESHDDILDLMEKEWKSFGMKHSQDPEIDAELNYFKAKTALLSRKMAQPKTPKPNVKAEKTVPTDVSMGTTQEVAPSTSDIHLDEFAADYVKRTGMKDDSVKEALKGETPIHLVKNR